MDYFKIVVTQEKRGIYFSVVPHKWEINKELFWPDQLKHKERELLRSNPASAPESDWARYPCILKMTNLEDFKEALKMEKQLSACSDTDAEESMFINMTQSHLPASQESLYRNSLFEGIDGGRDIHEELEQTRQDDDILVSYDNVAINSLSEQLDDLKLEIGQIGEALKSEIENVKKEIKVQYVKLNTYLDKIYQTLCDRPTREATNENNQEPVDLLKDFQFPLENSTNIGKFDEEIRRNPNFKIQLINTLSKIGGTSGDQDGTKVGYKIVDSVFTSDVLLQYSWTGISRGKSGEKKSFQKLDGLLEVMFEVILLADNRHTKQKNASIFRDGVLKHAKKRCQRKRFTKKNEEIKENDEEIEEVTENEEPQTQDSVESDIDDI